MSMVDIYLIAAGESRNCICLSKVEAKNRNHRKYEMKSHVINIQAIDIVCPSNRIKYYLIVTWYHRE